MLNPQTKRRLEDLNLLMATFRDGTLIVTVVLTVALVYFGGKPETLTSLDWAQLVITAALLVIVPFLAYLIFHRMFGIMEELYTAFGRLLSGSGRAPKGFSAWWFIQVRKMDTREYIGAWKHLQASFAKDAAAHPRRAKFMITLNHLCCGWVSYPRETAIVYAVTLLLVFSVVFAKFFLRFVE